MRPYIIFTKKGLFVVLSVFFCIGLICCKIYAVNNTTINAKTNADRLLFIKQVGYVVLSDQPESKTVHIPDVFYEVYKDYNELQKTAGYNLELYKGCEVMIYTYKIAPPYDHDDECVVNLIVYNDRIIGGDVSSTALGGFMLPLTQVKK